MATKNAKCKKYYVATALDLLQFMLFANTYKNL